MLNNSSKRVAAITARDPQSTAQQIKQATPFADVIELRLDFWPTLDLKQLAALRSELTLPVIFTLRKQAQGGECTLPEDQRLSLLQQLAKLTPEYMDLEYDTPESWLNEFRLQHPQITLIGSYHDFHSTPADLEKQFQPLLNSSFDIVKIATFAQTICDALRLLIFVKSYSQTRRIIAMTMGEDGQISRILAPVVGSLFTYGCIDTQSAAAPGQLTLDELTHIYRVHTLNRDTAIYALLGDPISQSPGHRVHNRVFALLEKNAVYVKCRIAPDKLAKAFLLLQKLPFYGMSVTIPHKETIVPYLDELIGESTIMRIVNTIKRDNNRYLGLNTDAPGAADVLEKIVPLAKKRVLILGAGGSGKAIAYALLGKDSEITLCNRTLARALDFTQQFGGQAISFDSLFNMTELPYDIIINTLPASAFAQQCADWKIPTTTHGIAMDIVLKPLETPFIQAAKIAGWRCLTGDNLFAAQALRQLKIWFDSEITLDLIKLI